MCNRQSGDFRFSLEKLLVFEGLRLLSALRTEVAPLALLIVALLTVGRYKALAADGTLAADTRLLGREPRVRIRN